jgi:glycerophosphoryl diester phosphodiesterase
VKTLILIPMLVMMNLTSASAANFEVQGHRGARWVRPENTLSAFHYALEQGVDTLEMDLNVTKHNVLVVVHDPFLNPDICLDAKGKKLEKPVMIRSLMLKELKTYDCGSLVNPRSPEQVVQPRERIPWTPNTEREWKKLLAFGVDGMISDNPKALLEFRSKN